MKTLDDVQLESFFSRVDNGELIPIPSDNKTIDHRYTDELVCPWCGYQYDESQDYFAGANFSEDLECPECERKFSGEAEYSVTYTTEKIGEEDDE